MNTAPNPYEAPTAAAGHTIDERPGGSVENLRRLATVHRRMNLIVLGNIFAVIGFVGLSMALARSPTLARLASTGFMLFLVVAWVGTAVTLYQLGQALGWSTVGCIFAVLSMFVGLINLAVILTAISKGNSILKSAGYKVGLLGVSPKQL